MAARTPSTGNGPRQKPPRLPLASAQPSHQSAPHISDRCACCEKSDQSELYYCTRCQGTLCATHWPGEHRGIFAKSHEKVSYSLAKAQEDAFNHVVPIGSGGEEQEEPHKDSITEMDKLFCFVDEKGDLAKGPNFYTIYPGRQTVIPIVGVIGAVGAGKYTLMRRVCSGECPVPPARSDSDDSASSSELHSFECKFGTFEALTVEMDGQFGGLSLPMETLAMRASMTNALTPAEKKELIERRKGIIRQVYPKFLYSFSNVIVFVLKDAQEIGTVIDELLVYAKSAAAGSVNAPNFPSLVIVFNKYTDACEPDYITSTYDFIKSAGPAAIAELRQYYHDLNVVYVPAVDNYNEVQNLKIFNRQRKSLSSAITAAMNASWERSQSTRPASRAEQFSLMATALKRLGDDPYATLDHVSLALAQRRISPSVRGFLKDYFDSLYLMYKSETQSPHDAWRLSSELMKHVVFSVYLSWCWRSSEGKFPHVGPSASVDSQFAPFLKDLSEHINDQAPCQAKHTFPPPVKEVQCETVRMLHTVGTHKSSKTYQAKEKISVRMLTNSVDGHPQSCMWTSPNGSRFEAPAEVDLLHHLETSIQQRDKPIVESEFRLIQKDHYDHQRDIVAKYLQMGNAKPARQCLGCLQHYPTEVLLCGHNFCSQCLSERPDEPCIICAGVGASIPLQIPKLAGIRVASFDGGGVRGIVIGSSLQKLEDLCYGIPAHDLFDLVVGTSTGGFLALGVAKKHMTALEIRNLYRTLAGRVFSSIPGISLLARLIRGYKYDAGPLERELSAVFGDERLFISVPRVAVTTCTPDSGSLKLCVMSSFVRPEKEGYPTLMPYYRVADAARATSAAGSFLPTYQDDKGQEFTDGGMLRNNPCEVALDEATLRWPDQPRDVLLSLGTGNFKRETQALRNGLIKFLGIFINIATNTTEAWDSLKVKPHKADSRFRVNPMLSKEYELDEAEQMDEMEADAMNDLNMSTSSAFQSIVAASHRLIKCLFYVSNAVFETQGDYFRVKLCIAPRVSLPKFLLEKCLTDRPKSIFKLECRVSGQPSEMMDPSAYSITAGQPFAGDPSRPTWTCTAYVSTQTSSISVKSSVGGMYQAFNSVDHISGSPFNLRLVNGHPDLFPHQQCPDCEDE